MSEGRRKEDAHLKEIERRVREFITDYYDPHMASHDRYFAPGTMRLVDDVRPLLDSLREVRAARDKQENLSPAL